MSDDDPLVTGSETLVFLSKSAFPQSLDTIIDCIQLSITENVLHEQYFKQRYGNAVALIIGSVFGFRSGNW
jgi:hypothetical protein